MVSNSVITVNQPWAGLLQKWQHKLFDCPTFWRLKPVFTCPRCGKRYRCYWDGHDVSGAGIDYCGKCAALLEKKVGEVGEVGEKTLTAVG